MRIWNIINATFTAVLIVNQTSGWVYRIQSTKTVYESLTDKMTVNVSVSKIKGLTVYLNVLEDFNDLYTEVRLVVDLNDKNEFDFDVVKRTINTCRLFNETTYEPVIQFLYKEYLKNGNFPTQCPIKKGLYYIKDMKTDPKNLPHLMSEKKAILSVKHSSKENQNMKLLVYYEVHFAVVKIGSPKTPKKPNRQRTVQS